MSLSEVFKNRLLWKVYLIWFLRRIVPLMLLQIAVFVVAFRIFANNVFVSKVLHNAAQVANAGYWEVFKYLVNSFLMTRPLTQIIIILILGVVALLLRDLIRILFTYKSLLGRK